MASGFATFCVAFATLTAHADHLPSEASVYCLVGSSHLLLDLLMCKKFVTCVFQEILTYSRFTRDPGLVCTVLKIFRVFVQGLLPFSLEIPAYTRYTGDPGFICTELKVATCVYAGFSSFFCVLCSYCYPPGWIQHILVVSTIYRSNTGLPHVLEILEMSLKNEICP